MHARTHLPPCRLSRCELSDTIWARQPVLEFQQIPQKYKYVLDFAASAAQMFQLSQQNQLPCWACKLIPQAFLCRHWCMDNNWSRRLWRSHYDCLLLISLSRDKAEQHCSDKKHKQRQTAKELITMFKMCLSCFILFFWVFLQCVDETQYSAICGVSKHKHPTPHLFLLVMMGRA